METFSKQVDFPVSYSSFEYISLSHRCKEKEPINISLPMKQFSWSTLVIYNLYSGRFNSQQCQQLLTGPPKILFSGLQPKNQGPH